MRFLLSPWLMCLGFFFADTVAVTTLTLEQKIDAAALQASQVVATFSPGVAVLIQSGVEIEPVISGLVQILVGLFKHHTASK